MSTVMPSSTGRRHRAAAWGVHVYTALGFPVAFLASAALTQGDARAFFLWLWLACFIDATDGTLARRLRVKEVLPQFDGRRLDDIIDFVTFVFLPAIALPALGLLPAGYELIAVLPMLASGYGFCQERAKTDESFVGFPSYWNIVVLYLYVLQVPPMVTVGVVVILSALVFVPIHYLYPSRTRFLRPITVGFGLLWAASLVPICLFPDEAWARTIAWWSLLYPVYYFLVSLVHHARLREQQRRAA